MSRFKHISSGDVVDVPDSLDGMHDARPEFERVEAEPEAATDVAETLVSELKGPALDEALRNLDLPTTGKADEKRQRLVDALADPPTPVIPETDHTDDKTEVNPDG